MRVEANGHGVVTDDLLTSEERADEFLLMGLRLAEGIDPERYTALSGRTLDPGRIAILREEGAIIVDADGRLRVTQAGFPVLAPSYKHRERIFARFRKDYPCGQAAVRPISCAPCRWNAASSNTPKVPAW